MSKSRRNEICPDVNFERNQGGDDDSKEIFWLKKAAMS